MSDKSHPIKVCEKEQETLIHIKFCWRTRWKILNNHKVTTTIVIPLSLLCQVAETLYHTDAELWAGIILAWCSSFSLEVLSKIVWKLDHGCMSSDSCQNLVSEHRKMVWICHCGDRKISLIPETCKTLSQLLTLPCCYSNLECKVCNYKIACFLDIGNIGDYVMLSSKKCFSLIGTP